MFVQVVVVDLFADVCFQVESKLDLSTKQLLIDAFSNVDKLSHLLLQKKPETVSAKSEAVVAKSGISEEAMEKLRLEKDMEISKLRRQIEQMQMQLQAPSPHRDHESSPKRNNSPPKQVFSPKMVLSPPKLPPPPPPAPAPPPMYGEPKRRNFGFGFTLNVGWRKASLRLKLFPV